MYLNVTPAYHQPMAETATRAAVVALMDELSAAVETPEFHEVHEAFIEQHCSEFEGFDQSSSSTRGGDSQAYKLEHWTVFLEYCACVERFLGQKLAQSQIGHRRQSVVEVVTTLNLQEDADLVRDYEELFETVQSVTDFEHFVQLMLARNRAVGLDNDLNSCLTVTGVKKP